MIRTTTPLLLAVLLPLLSGCPFTISSADLEGTIGGEAWVLEQGEAWHDEAGGTYALELYPELYVDCLTPPSGVSHLTVDLPDEVGEYELGEAGFTVVFVAWEDGGKVEYDPVQARAEVLEIDGAHLVAGVHARHSDAHDVDGQFDVPMCE